jgi:hypothetical protein
VFEVLLVAFEFVFELQSAELGGVGVVGVALGAGGGGGALRLLLRVLLRLLLIQKREYSNNNRWVHEHKEKEEKKVISSLFFNNPIAPGVFYLRSVQIILQRRKRIRQI